MWARKIFFLISVAFLIPGCANPHYSQTEANIADITQKTINAREKSNITKKTAAALIVNEGMYVDSTPINLIKQPGWLKNKIIIRGDQLDFSYYSKIAAEGGGKNILTTYQSGLNSTAKISVNYTGTVKGALDFLATKTGYVYTISDNQIYWQEFITKTFDIAFMPGKADYQLGKSSGSGGTSSSNAGSSTSAGAATTAGIVDDNTSQEYSNLKGNLSVWNDLKTSIKEMLSPDGKVGVSESTTTITVRDKPSNVKLIGNYIQNLNQNLSRQVLVKIEIVDISLNSAFNFGINWDVVGEVLKQKFLLKANYGVPVSVKPFHSSGASGLPQFGVKKIGEEDDTGVTAIINALSQQGKVSVVTQPRVVCLNNQVSVVRIVSQEGYIASVQTTALAGGTGSASNPVVSQITPGNVVSGLTLYVLPKILNNKVYLQVNADLSLLMGIDRISSQGTGDPDNSPSTAPMIQTPELSQKQFNQRALIESNETLVLSGFRQVTNQVGAMQLLNSQDLGGKASRQLNVETVVLITPVILSGIG